MSEHQTGKDHPNFAGRVEVKCGNCGASKKVTPRIAQRQSHHFCDPECRTEWLKLDPSDPRDRSPHTPKPSPYGEGWSEEKKDRVREDAGYECEDCSLSQSAHIEEFGEQLHVHHIHKAREINDPESRNSTENLVALCRSCHSKWEQMAPLRPDTPVD